MIRVGGMICSGSVERLTVWYEGRPFLSRHPQLDPRTLLLHESARFILTTEEGGQILLVHVG